MGTIRNPSKQEMEAILKNLDDDGGNSISKEQVVESHAIDSDAIEEAFTPPPSIPLNSLNPSEEDLKNAAKEKKKRNVANIVTTNTNAEKDFTIVDGAKIKSKKSRFEPDPIKCKLPSSGLGYRGEGITNDGCIFLRRMSSDEIVKLASIDGIKTFNKVCNDLFEACIVSYIDIQSMPIIDKIPVFIFLIGASINQKINVIELAECKNDSEKNIDFLIDINNLKNRVKQLNIKNLKYPFELNLSTFPNVKIKYIYPRISEESFILTDEVMTDDNALKLYNEITTEISGDVNNTPVTMSDLHEIMKWMSLEDKKAMKNDIDKMNEYSIDLSYKYSDHCSLGAKCCKAKETFNLNVQDLILELIKTLAEV